MRLWILAMVLLGALGAPAAEEEAGVAFVSQLPAAAESGGYQGSAEPYPRSGGWKNVYRVADDFEVAEERMLRSVTWWGYAYDGRHGESDSLEHVAGFAIEVYEAGADGAPGARICRAILPLGATQPEAIGREVVGGSDVYRHVGILPEAVALAPGRRYWLSIAAFLHGPPMWCWYMSEGQNGVAAVDDGVNGTWGDEPDEPVWEEQKDLAFALSSSGRPPEDGQAPAGGLDVDTLIEQLGAASFRDREAADAALQAMGEAVLPRLLMHRNSRDPEVRVRIRRLVALLQSDGKGQARLVIHMVAEGDTLVSIAKAFGLMAVELRRSNALPDETIAVGEMLKIPRESSLK